MRDLTETDRCAHFLKVVADTDRLQLIHLLRPGARNVTDLANELGKPIANVSHHLKILRQAGLVETHKHGKLVSYQLADGFFGLTKSTDKKCCLDLGCCRLDLSPIP